MSTSNDRQRLARASAEFWAGGAGPTHTEIERALDSLDLLESTPGGTKYDRVHGAVLQVDEAQLRGLLAVLVDLLHERGYFDEGEPHRAPDRAIRMLRSRLRPYGLILNDKWQLEGGAALGVEPGELLGLPELEDHIRRIQMALVGEDSELLLGSSKELLETTAKFVLDGSGRPAPSKFPGLLSEALDLLGLHPKAQKSADGEVGAATRQILGGLQQIGLGINELRNDHGTGHGRVTTVKLSLRHARLAAGSACVLSTAMLDTYKDPSAPWRKAQGS